MKVAFLFPGQGMQDAVMPEFIKREGREQACLARNLGGELWRTLAPGQPSLERTDVLQPALVAVCLSVTARLLASGLRPEVVAGHSLGEIAAVAAAGGLSTEDAIAVAAARGRLMAREAARRPGGMLALLEATADVAEAAVSLGAPHGVIALAAVNAPDQWVLSGEARALDVVATRFASRRLPVVGAWHCELMAGALPELLSELEARPFRPLSATFVANRAGEPLGEREDLSRSLAEQLVRPVQWVATLTALERMKVTDVVTVGPGRILRGLVRKSLGSRVRVHGTEDDTDLERTVERLRGNA